MKGIAGASRGRLRSGFLRRAGTAFPNASRTIRRCTPSFLATPKTVPTPNSYSRRISSNSSTLALQSTATSAPGSRPQQSSRSFPRWAKSHDQSGPIQSIEIRERLKHSKLAYEGSLRDLAAKHQLTAPDWTAAVETRLVVNLLLS